MKYPVTLLVSCFALTACGSGGNNGNKPEVSIDSVRKNIVINTTEPTNTNNWKAKVREVKLIVVDQKHLLLNENVELPTQTFNLDDEKIGKVEQNLGKDWSFNAYNQEYSAVGFILPKNVKTDGTGQIIDERVTNEMAQVIGAKTEILPKGSATYQGISFGVNTSGKLTLSANFDNQSLSGNITERKLIDSQKPLEDIKLNEATIKSNGEFWGATNDNEQGSYSGSFYGPNAEEIGGTIKNSNNDIYEVFTGKSK